jgi:hypothetical protein
MKPWQAHLEKLLSARDAPPVLTRDLLSRFARSARGGTVLADSSLTHWLKTVIVRGKLRAVQRGVYLNQFRPVAGTLADAAPLLRADAVVSLNTVLGDAGVLNNPSHTVTVVVPIDAGAPPPKLGAQQTQAGNLRFFGLPRRILEAGAADARLASEVHFEHPRATPEKALIDWLYLANSPRSKRTQPPRGDIDLALLNKARLARLAKAAKMEQVLKTWQAA